MSTKTYHKTTPMLYLTIVALSLSLLPQAAIGGIVEGFYSGPATWVYLDKFCFRSDRDEAGTLDGTISFPADAPAPALMAYFKASDEDDLDTEWANWNSVYKGGLTCTEKYNRAKSGGLVIKLLDAFSKGRTLSKPSTQEMIIYPGVDDDFENPQTAKVAVDDVFGDMREYWTVTVSTRMETTRQRWLFLAVGNCEQSCAGLRFCASPVEIKYYLKLKNGDSYFSADEDWNLGTFTFFLVAYGFLNLFAIRNRHYLERLRKFHPSVLLLNTSVHLHLVYITGGFIFNIYFEGRGLRLEDLWVFSVVYGGLSEFCLLLHIILVSKGWTIVRRKISATGRVKIAVYMTAYVMIYIAAVVYYVAYTDPGEVTYIYDTPPGIILVICRFAAFGWLQFSLYTTRRNYKGKRRFYQKYNFFASMWVLTLPVFVLINRSLDAWVRAKVMLLLSTLVSMATHTILLILYNPQPFLGTFVAKSFPFHATTVAMLRNRKDGDLTKVRSNVGDIFSDFHLNRATELSQKVRQGLSVLQSYTADLFSFLAEIKTRDDAVDIEQGGKPLPTLIKNEKWAGSRPNGAAVAAPGDDGPSDLLKSIPRNKPKIKDSSQLSQAEQKQMLKPGKSRSSITNNKAVKGGVDTDVAESGTAAAIDQSKHGYDLKLANNDHSIAKRSQKDEENNLSARGSTSRSHSHEKSARNSSEERHNVPRPRSRTASESGANKDTSPRPVPASRPRRHSIGAPGSKETMSTPGDTDMPSPQKFTRRSSHRQSSSRNSTNTNTSEAVESMTSSSLRTPPRSSTDGEHSRTLRNDSNNATVKVTRSKRQGSPPTPDVETSLGNNAGRGVSAVGEGNQTRRRSSLPRQGSSRRTNDGETKTTEKRPRTASTTRLSNSDGMPDPRMRRPSTQSNAARVPTQQRRRRTSSSNASIGGISAAAKNQDEDSESDDDLLLGQKR